MTIDLTIEPDSTRYSADHPGWSSHTAVLFSGLQSEVGGLHRSGAPTTGHRGAAEAIILALGSSGAITAAVACFQAWLKADKTRSVTLTWTDEHGSEQRITVAGEHLDQQSFQVLVESIGRRLEQQ
ncbi:hypothetical protein O1R50_09210 [Glycomyces luteolus]|uniref:Uncharacterized protein n=1 Tax=Glycomyces luteolus TaxID=2670330 RepID=A0A9X3T3B2_9ACTN|nr:hypothetical protein [Glycomyces luteolus]MDA1359800.1 hypothetical protein [Glycomyces luteolus]